MNILVLGSSASAISFIDTYKKKNKEDKITIITLENTKPYFRPMLSHMLGNDEIPSGFFVKKEEFYSENNIKIYYNEEAISINTDSKIVTTNKSTYNYDKLVLAIGSNNFVPSVKGVELENVCNLKFYSDLENINQKLKGIDDVTVIGGGLLGLEAAWTLRNSGKKVSVLEFSNKLLARQMDINGAKFITKELEKSGIEVKTNANVVEILGDSKVEGYKLEDGSCYKTNMILYSVGVRPNLNIIKNCGLSMNRGVLVDENYLTSNSDIYALGDVAEINSMVNGTWVSAMNSGKIAANHLLNEENKPVSSMQLPVILKALNVDVTSIGIIDEEIGLPAEESIDRYVRYFVRDNILVGAIVIGDKKLSTKLASMINKELKL